jgi:hypothetical protein
MEAVKRNANSKEIVAITVQENATGMMINTKNNASNRVLRNCVKEATNILKHITFLSIVIHATKV